MNFKQLDVIQTYSINQSVKLFLYSPVSKVPSIPIHYRDEFMSTFDNTVI